MTYQFESTSHQRSRAQEKRLAKRLEGRRQPASGALPGKKGDVLSGADLMIEAKTTGMQSYRIEENDLITLSNNAAIEAREPVLVVQFEEMPSGTPNEWAAIPMSFFQELLATWRSSRSALPTTNPERKRR